MINNAMKFMVLSSLFALGVLFMTSARASAQATETTSAQRYFVRVFNCDDGCTAGLGGTATWAKGDDFARLTYTEFGQDSGWIDFTDALQPGKNTVRFWVFSRTIGFRPGSPLTGAIAYGFQIRKNNALVFNQVCGRAGTLGCENNRIFPQGPAREFSYEVYSERPVAYERWLAFYAAFRAAVNARDRAALRTMISSSYDCGGLCTVDQVIKGLDRGNNVGLQKGWRGLQKSVALGTRADGLNENRRPERQTKDGMYAFEFGPDGRWWWSGENVGD